MSKIMLSWHFEATPINFINDKCHICNLKGKRRNTCSKHTQFMWNHTMKLVINDLRGGCTHTLTCKPKQYQVTRCTCWFATSIPGLIKHPIHGITWINKSNTVRVEVYTLLWILWYASYLWKLIHNNWQRKFSHDGSNMQLKNSLQLIFQMPW